MEDPTTAQDYMPDIASSVIPTPAISDQSSVARIEQLLKEIRRRPREGLAKYASQLFELSQSLHKLAVAITPQRPGMLSFHHEDVQENVDCRHLPLREVVWKPTELPPPAREIRTLRPAAEMCTHQTRSVSPQVKITTDINPQQAFKALRCASKCVERVERAISYIDQHLSSWFEQDQRISHLAPISRLQDKGLSREEYAQDQVLLVLASLSIANDFRHFEKQSGWIPRQDLLLEPILRGKEPASHRIGNHVPNFASALSIVDRDRLVAGLRFGIKLQLIQRFSNASYWPGIAMFLGFEGHKISRLSYSALPALKSICEESSEFESLRLAAARISSWWSTCQARYNSVLSKYHVAAPTILPGSSRAVPKPTDKDRDWEETKSQNSPNSLCQPLNGKEFFRSSDYFDNPPKLIKENLESSERLDFSRRRTSSSPTTSTVRPPVWINSFQGFSHEDLSSTSAPLSHINTYEDSSSALLPNANAVLHGERRISMSLAGNRIMNFFEIAEADGPGDFNASSFLCNPFEESTEAICPASPPIPRLPIESGVGNAAPSEELLTSRASFSYGEDSLGADLWPYYPEQAPIQQLGEAIPAPLDDLSLDEVLRAAWGQVLSTPRTTSPRDASMSGIHDVWEAE